MGIFFFSGCLQDWIRLVIYLKPSLVRDFKFPIDSGISNNSLCWRSKELICTQFPISEKNKIKTFTTLYLVFLKPNYY